MKRDEQIMSYNFIEISILRAISFFIGQFLPAQQKEKEKENFLTWL